jgi:hypothetical protein
VDLGHFQWVCVGNRKAIQDVLAKYGPVSMVGCYRPARELRVRLLSPFDCRT